MRQSLPTGPVDRLRKGRGCRRASSRQRTKW